MVHPILALIALGGLIYSFSPMCPPATRWSQRVCYLVMLWLSWMCPWPGWVIVLACFGGDIVFRALSRPRWSTPEEFCEAVRKAALREERRRKWSSIWRAE
jgi:hypothetical protein